MALIKKSFSQLIDQLITWVVNRPGDHRADARRYDVTAAVAALQAKVVAALCVFGKRLALAGCAASLADSDGTVAED